MNVLGISAFYHDSAAALCTESEIICAAQEERFSRVKHDKRFPKNAVEYCLSLLRNSSDLDAIAYYSNPFLKLDRFINNLTALGADMKPLLERGFDTLFNQELRIDKIAKEAAGTLGKHGKLIAVEHHMSHAASAFFPSPFDEACILTIDGVGEWSTTTIGMGKDNHIDLLKDIKYPHSLGMLYTAVTVFCGFKANSGEYKLMGLAPYGVPEYYELMKDKLIDIKDDGSYRLNMEYFSFHKADEMTNALFSELFGGKAREGESMITRREMNIAASVQKLCEEIVIKLARNAKKETSAKRLCMAGGVALNCVANGKLLRERIFDDIWIQPAAGDAGGALGAALFSIYQVLGQRREAKRRGMQSGSYLGPAYSADFIREFLKTNGYIYKEHNDRQSLYQTVAEELKNQKVVGLFSGRMEFGPRALGARSIIADARSKEMQSKLNLKIKYRESFRPFAPSVLAERADDYFELNGNESPYMLLVADVNESRRKAFALEAFVNSAEIDMLPIVNQERSDIPAVTHVDFSARVQTVNKEDNPEYHALIKAFEEQTGCAVIVNTSFNVRGEPIVSTPMDAYKCFMRTEMDVLVLENFVLYKSEQPKFIDDEDWREEYGLD